MSDDDQDEHNERDELRLEIAIQSVKDILVRFEESNEGTRSVYEVLGFALQDLINDGLCAACLNEAVTHAFTESGADLENHQEEEGSVLH